MRPTLFGDRPPPRLRALSIGLLAALSITTPACDDDDPSPTPAGAVVRVDASPVQPDAAGVASFSFDGGTAEAGIDAPSVDVASGVEDARVDAESRITIPFEGDRRVPFAPDDDLQFIDFFIPHQQIAIEMAQLEIDRGDAPDVKALARQMRDDHLSEVVRMRTARQQLTGSGESPSPPPDPDQQRHLAQLRLSSGPALDRLFLANMIPQHATAVTAAHRAQPNLKRADLLELARTIEDRRAGDIAALEGKLGPLEQADTTAPARAGDGGPGQMDDTDLVGDRRVPFTPADDAAFTDFFIPHHQIAIMMAELVMELGSRAEVKSLATGIRYTQTHQIGEMMAARTALGVPPDPTPPPPADPVMEAELAAMRSLIGPDLDRMFLLTMIPHHAAGLPTAFRAPSRLKRPELRRLALDIYDSQAQEIAAMHALLAGSAAPDAGTD
jgi:uncharacterized protein (DUF305 family)